ncbi:MAG: class I SAM-dependent methyltransferase [Methylacidiphilales bacterium]|nr:class I SAM-dependent methyltransferase [Candidatus Methylacidiphilales bacterium]
MTFLRDYFRELYFRSKLFRHLTPWLIDDRPPPIDYSHLLSFREEQIGPLQRDEALALFGLTRVLHPQTIVEFGFLNGHSALNFLLAAGPDCRVFSYDITERAEEIARRCLGHFKNFRFIKKSQADFSPLDIENRKIDLCFLDASHDLILNLKTFELVRPHLSEMAIIAIHDTGVWHREFLKNHHRAFIATDLGKSLGRWIDKEQFQPVVDERRFVNDLLRNHPDFSQVHLHSANTLRNGLTLLQKEAFLPTDPTPEK